MRRCRWVLVSALAGVLAAGPAGAEVRDFLVSRKFYGAVSAGTGIFFLLEAANSRQEAGDVYEEYQAAGTSARARELYDESRSKDTEAAILLGLGLGTLAYGVHLWLSEDSEDLPEPRLRRGLVRVKGVTVDLGRSPVAPSWQLQLRKGF